MDILLSIIIPVYNGEKYLKQCIISVLKQTYQKFELIIVDDGSIDKTAAIVDGFIKQDNRIRYIYKEHSGLVNTRMYGVTNSKGEYIGFVDADDQIDENMYEAYISCLEEHVGVVAGGYYTYTKDGNVFKNLNTLPQGLYEEKDRDILFGKMIFDFEKDRPGVVQSLCTKIIKRELLIKSYENINKQISLGEDAVISYQCILHSPKTALTNVCKYYYRTNQESMCNQSGDDTFKKINYFYQSMNQYFNGLSDRWDFEKQIKMYVTLFFQMTLKKDFNIECTNEYRTDFLMLESNTHVALYGAGKVGRSYYKTLCKKVNIDHWVDQYFNRRIFGRQIEAVSVLNNSQLDYVVLAINDETIVGGIKQKLANLGIAKEKILWKKPQVDRSFFYFDVNETD